MKPSSIIDPYDVFPFIDSFDEIQPLVGDDCLVCKSRIALSHAGIYDNYISVYAKGDMLCTMIFPCKLTCGIEMEDFELRIYFK